MRNRVEIKWRRGNPKPLCKRTLYFITIKVELCPIGKPKSNHTKNQTNNKVAQLPVSSMRINIS
jgi:hypothetical protein